MYLDPDYSLMRAILTFLLKGWQALCYVTFHSLDQFGYHN